MPPLPPLARSAAVPRPGAAGSARAFQEAAVALPLHAQGVVPRLLPGSALVEPEELAKGEPFHVPEARWEAAQPALVVGVLCEGTERRGRVLRLLGADGRGRGPTRRRGPARGPPPGGRSRLDPAAGAGTGEALIAPPPRRCHPWAPSGRPPVPVPRTCPRARASCRLAPATGLLRRRRGGRLLARGRPRVLLLQQALGAVRLLPYEALGVGGGGHPLHGLALGAPPS